MKICYAPSHRTRSFCFVFCFLFYTSISHAQTNQAINLDGFSGYADLGPVSPADNFSSGLTVECWVKWGAFNNWSRLLDMGNGPGGDNILFANEGTLNNLRLEVYNGSSTSGISGPDNLVTDRWYHVAATVNSAGAATIYVDGVAVASGTINVPVNIARYNCYIGRSNWAVDGYLNGVVDEMRIWNVVRTQSEIKQYMFKPVAPNATGLVAYYTCNEGSGMELTNSCTNGIVGSGSISEGLSWTTSPAQFSANALGLDGMDDYVSIGAPLYTGASYTKEAWVYITDPIAARNVVSSYDSPFWIDNGSLKAGNNRSFAEVTDPGSFPASTWVHVAVSYDALTGEMRLYRNGNLVASSISEFSYLNEDNFIGAWYNGAMLSTESYLGGKIDEVRIWNVVRTQTDIQANMNKELNPATEANLVAYYTFNQNNAEGDNTGVVTVVDQSGTNNGILTNMDMFGTASNFVQQQGTLVALPVNFTSFTAQKQGGGVALHWTTASERNSADFVVQRSTDGRNWTSLTIIAATGNSTSAQSYTYVDASPVAGTNLYRIQQRDRDGKSSYSKIGSVVFEQKAITFSVQNHVVNNGILQVQVNQPIALSLYAQDGRLLWSKKLAAGSATIETGTYAKGIYFLKGAGTTEKIVLQ